jgi:hypothetical protein
MNSIDTLAVLNHLLVLHRRSLPMYLSFAVPWVQAGDTADGEALALIVADQQRMADRLGAMIVEADGVPNEGEFPSRFTAWNDLSFVYLRQKLVGDQQQRIAAMERCVGQLRLAPLALAVAQEALGEARGHLETLRELAAQPVAAATK